MRIVSVQEAGTLPKEEGAEAENTFRITQNARTEMVRAHSAGKEKRAPYQREAP